MSKNCFLKVILHQYELATYHFYVIIFMQVVKLDRDVAPCNGHNSANGTIDQTTLGVYVAAQHHSSTNCQSERGFQASRVVTDFVELFQVFFGFLVPLACALGLVDFIHALNNMHFGIEDDEHISVVIFASLFGEKEAYGVAT